VGGDEKTGKQARDGGETDGDLGKFAYASPHLKPKFLPHWIFEDVQQ